MEPGEGHGDAPAQASFVDPTASISLLTVLFANPLDAGHEHYQVDHDSWSASLVSHIAILAMAVTLGLGSVVATDSLWCPANDVKADLKEQTAVQSSNVEALSDELQSLGRVTDDLLQPGSSILVDGMRGLVTATRPINDPGITVTLMDRNGPGKGSGTVRGQDVAMIVNALRAAGAEVISVNSQRTEPNTFVRTAGAAILINVIPASSPYEVTAIGGSNALFVVLVRGAASDYLSAARSVSGMTMNSKVFQLLNMRALTPSSSQYTQPLDT